MGATVYTDATARETALDPTRSFCVTAPAGSGKTELLTQRILGLLARVSRPEQVLAITFTRKAAAEMRARLLLKLDDARRDVPVDAPHEQRTRTLAHAVLTRAEELGWRLDADTFNLRTIDSLCADLTRQMPVLSALGGAVEVTDRYQPLFEQAVSGLLESVAAEDATGEALRALLLHFDNDWERLRKLLVKLLERRADWSTRLGQHRAPEDAERDMSATVLALTDAVLNQLVAGLDDQYNVLAGLSTLAAENLGLPPPDLRAAHDCLEHWRFAVGLLLNKSGDWRKRWDKNSGFPPDFKQEKAAMADLVAALDSRGVALRDLLEEIRMLPTPAPGDAGWQRVLHLSHLLPVLHAQLLVVFQQQGRVDYTHIALAAEHALGTDEQPTDLSLRLDYQIEHILVDEFQDTSDQQFRLLEKLTRGWAEHNATTGAPRTLFIVGDGMQSIYGFRYANVGLFIEARDRGIGGLRLEALSLTRNFRSQEGVVAWVNRVFSQVFPEQDEIERGRVRHAQAESTRDSLPGEAVAAHLFEDDGVSEAAFVANTICELRDSEPTATIAILVRARRHAMPIIEALRFRRIAFVGRDLELLSQQQTVLDLLCLCRWLANPADEVAALSLLRAPFVGLDLPSIHMIFQGASRPLSLRQRLRAITTEAAADPESHLSANACARAQHLLQALDWGLERRDRLALPVWVEQIWLRLGGPWITGSEQASDAGRFFDLLADLARDGLGLDIDELEGRIEKLFAEHEAQNNPVELMTLHKSKGLEYDYVFMPALASGTASNDRALLRWHLHRGAESEGLLLAADDRQAPAEPSLYNYLSWLQRQREQAELRRLLYVGVTRARQRAYLTASSQGEDDGPRWPGPRSPLGILGQVIRAEVSVHTSAEDAMAPESSNDGAGALLVDDAIVGYQRVPMEVLASRGAEDRVAITGKLDNAARERLFQPGNLLERLVGTVLHRVLEQLSVRDSLPDVIDSEIETMIDFGLLNAGLSGNSLTSARTRVMTLVESTLADPRGRWILQNTDNSASEMAAFADWDGELKRQVIDRVRFDTDTGIYWVVDYKTSQPREDESLAVFLERERAHYAPQLQRYGDLVLQLSEPGSAVRQALYFPAIPHWYPLEEVP